MSELIIYLLKANIALFLFYLGFRFGLRNLTFYKLNRFYILFALIFSSIYPLVNWVELFEVKKEIPTSILTVIPDWQQLQVSSDHISWNQVFEGVFWISVVFFFIRFLIKLGGILRIHLKSNLANWSIFTYRKSKEDIIPFSFLKNIYVNPDKHKDDELEKIFKHEYIHVIQLHSTDILIAEVALCFYWYNPICWLLIRDLKENIEFITDQEVLSLGVDKQSYQYSLLNISNTSNQPALGNHFNFKNLKKRIIMMNKKRTSRIHLSKYAFILPAVVVGSLIFGISKAREHNNDQTIIDKILDINTFDAKQDSTVKKEKIKLKGIPSQKKETEVKGKEDTDLSNKTVIQGVKADDNQDGYLLALIDTNENGSIDVSKLGDWGTPVAIAKSPKEGETRTRIVVGSSTKVGPDPLYILDGKTISPNPLGEIKSEDIESIEVLKDQAATELYGDAGKNGVIIITSKGKKDKSTGTILGSRTNKSSQKSNDENLNTVTVVGYNSKDTIKNNSNSKNLTVVGYGSKDTAKHEITMAIRGEPATNPLIYIDGKEVNKETFNKLDTNDIKSISVLKGKATIDKYGKEAKDGVIEIETKKAVKK